MSAESLRKALDGGTITLDAWLEAQSEDEVREAIRSLIKARADESFAAGYAAAKEELNRDREYWRRVWAGQAMAAIIGKSPLTETPIDEACEQVEPTVIGAFEYADAMIAADGGFGD